MVMMISKFHRMIQSRVVWGVLLVLIIIAFVYWGSQTGKSVSENEQDRAAGMLNGQPVSPEEFQRSYLNSRVAVGLMVGRMPQQSAEFEKELRKTTWQRIAATHQALALGLPTTTDNEVRNAIESQPAFQQEGRFSEQRFAMFVRSTLNELGIGLLQFEDYLRQEILLEKLRVAVSSTLQVAPTEVQQTVAAVSDFFRLDYAVIPADTNAAKRVTVKEAQALFDRDPKAFTIPEKVQVSYVVFPFSNYVAGVTSSVDEATAYYNENLQRFTRLVSVTNPPPLGVTNAAPTISQQQERMPFDNVKTNIFDLLKQEGARSRAADLASEFANQLAPDRKGKYLTLVEAAAKSGLTIRTAGPFAAGEPLPAIEDVPLFTRTAFALGTNTDERFSDGIRGADGMYVLYLDKRLPARVPAFAEVVGEALAAARAEANTKAQEAKANEVREALAKAPPAQPVAAIVQPLGVASLTLTGAVMTARSSTNENAEVLLRAAMLRNAGEVCDIQRGNDGSLLVARVTERKTADAAVIKELLPQVQASVQRQKLRALDESFSASLLTADRFTDRRARIAAEDEAAEPDRRAPDRREVPANIY